MENTVNDFEIESSLSEAILPLLDKGSWALKFRSTPIQHGLKSSLRVQERELAQSLRAEAKASLVDMGIESDQIVTTLSHSRTADTLGVVVLCSNLQVGVDLEWASRPTHEALSTRILKPKEVHLSLGVLDFWVVKEACFKAFPLNSGTVLPQYEVTNWDSSTGRGQVRPPLSREKYKCDFKWVRIASWIFVFAVCHPASIR